MSGISGTLTIVVSLKNSSGKTAKTARLEVTSDGCMLKWLSIKWYVMTINYKIFDSFWKITASFWTFVLENLQFVYEFI